MQHQQQEHTFEFIITLTQLKGNLSLIAKHFMFSVNVKIPLSSSLTTIHDFDIY